MSTISNPALFPPLSSNSSPKKDIAKTYTKTTTSKVGNNAFQDLNSYFSAAMTPLQNRITSASVSFLYRTMRKNDCDFLRKLTGSDVSVILKQVVPQLPSIISNLLPDGFIKQFSQTEALSTEKLGEIVMIHIVANVAASLYPEAASAFRSGKPINRVIAIGDLQVKASLEIMHLLAMELNSIDAALANGVEANPQLFEPLAEQLLDRF